MNPGNLPDAVLWRVLRVVGLEPAGDRRGLADRSAARDWRDPDGPERLGHSRTPSRPPGP